ncbi:MAG: galactokinase [Saprospiraceae bacterium]|nr:galactokinase [Saprospiraceae bacterium]MCB9323412.1 galactokinase [Lewinellaceae bacterium]
MTDQTKANLTKDSITVQSPGRINIIGEHTDYNDGFVFPAAVDKMVKVHMKRNGSEQTANIKADNFNETHTMDLHRFSPIAPGWQNYVMGVISELQKLGANIKGFDASFSGDVPLGGGMSSSAALECSFALALNELFDLGLSKDQMIKASQMAEHHFVGTKCGIMDQFASMMGKKDQVILLDCRTLEYQYFPLELGEYQLLLLNTNVSHSLASSEYNTRSAECETGVAHLKKIYPGIKNLRDISLQQLEDNKSALEEIIFRRCHHVVSENERVLRAAEAMQQGDHKLLGELIYQSHFSLQHDYEVSCPELDFLVKQTLDKDYVLGSRMMGGGFGGCTISILRKDKLDSFTQWIAKSYHDKFGIEVTPISVSIGDGTKAIY